MQTIAHLSKLNWDIVLVTRKHWYYCPWNICWSVMTYFPINLLGWSIDIPAHDSRYFLNDSITSLLHSLDEKKLSRGNNAVITALNIWVVYVKSFIHLGRNKNNITSPQKLNLCLIWAKIWWRKITHLCQDDAKQKVKIKV